MSQMQSVNIEVESMYEGIDFMLNISRARFESLNDSIFRCVKRTLNNKRVWLFLQKNFGTYSPSADNGTDRQVALGRRGARRWIVQNSARQICHWKLLQQRTKENAVVWHDQPGRSRGLW